MGKKIAVNGFGRIGRNFLRACLGNEGVEIVLSVAFRKSSLLSKSITEKLGKETSEKIGNLLKGFF